MVGVQLLGRGEGVEVRGDLQKTDGGRGVGEDWSFIVNGVHGQWKKG